MRKKIKSTLWTKISTTFNEKKFNSSSRKENLKTTLGTKIPKPQINKKVSKTNFQKFNCSLWRNNWTWWTSEKFMSPLCLLNFLHVVQIVNLKDATQPLPKLQWRSSFGQHYWGHQCPRISNGAQLHHVCKMGKGRDWNKYSWASSSVTWLLQTMLEHFCSSKVDAFFKVATATLAITLVSFLWPFGCPLW